MRDNETETTSERVGQQRTPLAAIIVSSLATTVLIAVIIAGSLYVYHLFPNMRVGSLQEELLSWSIIIASGLACIGVLLLGGKFHRRFTQRGTKP